AWHARGQGSNPLSSTRHNASHTSGLSALAVVGGPALVLSPADEQSAGFLLDGGAEGCAGGPEAVPHPGGVLAGGQAGVAVLQLPRERFRRERAAPVQGDQEQQAEVVAQPRINPVVIQEVAQVVQDPTGDPVGDMRGG